MWAVDVKECTEIHSGDENGFQKSHRILACINRNAVPSIRRRCTLDCSLHTVRAAVYSVLSRHIFRWYWSTIDYGLNSCPGLQYLAWWDLYNTLSGSSPKLYSSEYLCFSIRPSSFHSGPFSYSFPCIKSSSFSLLITSPQSHLGDAFPDDQI